MPTIPAEDRSFRPADGAFAYTCHRCRRCCTGKRIWVNPYEVFRLARRLGLTTTRFLEQYTVNGGTELAVRDDLSCVFLGEQGCTVHGDRPLVCRLYPLGRAVQTGAPDRYFTLEPHPQSEGVFSDDGTVAEYLEQQGAAPFLAAADTYFALLDGARDTLAELVSHHIERTETTADDIAHDDATAEHAPSPWLDIDAVLAAESGTDDLGARDVPSSLSAEEAMARHVAILERWHDTLRAALTHRRNPSATRNACSSHDASDHVTSDHL
jgi:Fe-S-cluster containining protein